MFTRIVVPLDTSLVAECVVPQVRTLARKWAAKVELVLAIESPSPAAELDGERYLAGTASLFASPIHVDCTVKVGAPADVIIETAGDRLDTLIAMSTRGRTGIERWLLESVADKVLQASESPVLLVRGGRTVRALHRRLSIKLRCPWTARRPPKPRSRPRPIWRARWRFHCSWCEAFLSPRARMPSHYRRTSCARKNETSKTTSSQRARKP